MCVSAWPHRILHAGGTTTLLGGQEVRRRCLQEARASSELLRGVVSVFNFFLREESHCHQDRARKQCPIDASATGVSIRTRSKDSNDRILEVRENKGAALSDCEIGCAFGLKTRNLAGTQKWKSLSSKGTTAPGAVEFRPTFTPQHMR